MPDRDFNGVELARTGTFRAVTGPVTFTLQDFDNMAEASQALKGKVDPPLKLGHNDEQRLLHEDGLPAAGWIENVRRIGNRLVADFKRVPEKIADLIESGGLRKRSLEAVRNGEFAGKRYPMVLVGAALLGEQLPAVDTLDDIAALYTAAEMDMPGSEDADAEVLVVAASDANEADGLIDELNELMGRVDALTKNRRGAPRMRALAQTAIAELRRVTNTKAGMEGYNMDLEKLAKLLGVDATEEAVEAAIGEMASSLKTLQDEKKALEAKAEESAKPDEALVASLAEMQAEVITLKSERARDMVTMQVDAAIKAKRFVPAVRDNLIEMAMSSPDAFVKLVENTPENTILATGEIGSGEAGDDWKTRFALNSDEQAIRLQMGFTEEEAIRAKAAEAGVVVPDPA